MILAIVNKGLLSGFSMGSRNDVDSNISHLLFASAIYSFCKASPNHLHNLLCLFLCFEMVSDLRVNLAKSELILLSMSIMLKAWLVSWVARWSCLKS